MVENVKGDLADAVWSLNLANERLVTARSIAEAARRDESNAMNNVNKAQEYFDKLVQEVKNASPKDSDWKRKKPVLLTVS